MQLADSQAYPAFTAFRFGKGELMKRMVRYTAVACSALAALLMNTSTASAAPTEVVLPIPLVGLATGPTGLIGPFIAGYIKATTDPDLPGVTQFDGVSDHCMCNVHWRNLTTGAEGTAYYWFGGGETDKDGLIETGSGVVTAVATAGGVQYPLTFVPGAGVFTVP